MHFTIRTIKAFILLETTCMSSSTAVSNIFGLVENGIFGRPTLRFISIQAKSGGETLETGGANAQNPTSLGAKRWLLSKNGTTKQGATKIKLNKIWRTIGASLTFLFLFFRFKLVWHLRLRLCFLSCLLAVGFWFYCAHKLSNNGVIFSIKPYPFGHVEVDLHTHQFVCWTAAVRQVKKVGNRESVKLYTSAYKFFSFHNMKAITNCTFWIYSHRF